MKKGKLFAQIIYYVFMFFIGILLAIFLPYILTLDEALDIVNDSLMSGNYADAMQLSANYFDTKIVYEEEFGQGGIVLFSSATLTFDERDEDATLSDTKLHKSYSGFVYGVKDTYDIFTTENNQAKLIVYGNDGVPQIVSILDYDADGDGSADGCSTHMQYGLFFVEFAQEDYDSLKELELVDKNGDTYVHLVLNEGLSFEEPFFDDIDAFLTEYNAKPDSEKLDELRTEFFNKSSDYKSQTMRVANSRADKRATVIVVVYFVFVYIIGDLLVGGHYIIKFFRWLLVKVFKIKFKRKEPVRSELFGNDYFSKVTLVLDVSELENFSQSVQIRYNNEKGEEASFVLMKEQNYSDTQRIKAGTYVNMWIDVDKNVYATQNLPEKLVVQGYQMAIKVKLIKREEKRL